ncbi:MAG: hydrolase, partial [Proteobacteria bacterium]
AYKLLSSSAAGQALKNELEWIDLGLCRYQLAWELQKKRQSALIDGSGAECAIICEHLPVITLGRSTKASSLLVPEAAIAEKGIELFEVERGGDATYHGPGQLILYPILNLNLRKRDVGWYMRSLEQVILDLLDHFGIKGVRVPGKTGVWTEKIGNDSLKAGKKIASLGVRISRWCTLHGISLNVGGSLDGFSLINPCGFSDITVTSMSAELGSTELGAKLETSEVKPVLQAMFRKHF